ncbi:MAG: methyl-accepting chemotaxis protein, partial [Nitrospirota bacterium]
MNMLTSMNLKTRAVLMTIGILLLVLAFNTLVNITAATQRYREALMARTTTIAEDIRKEVSKAIVSGRFLHAIPGMGERLHSLMEEDADIQGIMIMNLDGRVLYAGDRSLENKILATATTRKALAGTKPIIQQDGGHYEKVIPLFDPAGKKTGVLRIALKEEVVNRQIGSLLQWSLMVSFISFLIAAILVYYLIDRVITRPIMEMGETAGRMAAGDLSGGITVKGKTEIANLAGAINTMSANLKEMLRKIKGTGTGLTDASKLVVGAVHRMSEGARIQQESTDQTATIVNEMAASIKSVAENTREMSQAAASASSSASVMASSLADVACNTGELAGSVEDTSSSIGQMIVSIKQVSDNTNTVASAAEQTSLSIIGMSESIREVEQRAVESARLAEKVSRDASQRGMVAAAEAMKGMQNIREAVEATAAVINRLGKRSQEIGQILKVVDEVTDQTGLLALNAAILAAQAGERGKGFAVVAEEIKDLAERTAASTQEIATLVLAVQEETAESVHAMGKGLRAVETGSSLVTVTNEVLEQVAESSRRSSDMARAIEKTTGEQAKGAARIMETSAGIASQIEQIAAALQEQRKGSERIAQAAERMREITQQVQAATQEQTIGSRKIADAVESVTVQAAQVARSTSEQSNGAHQISEAISNIQRITQDTVDVS